MLSRSVAQQLEETSHEDQHMEDEDDEVHNIDTLQEYGIQQGDIKKLKAASYFFVKDVLLTPVRELLKIKGISEAKVDTLLAAASKITTVGSFMTCSDLQRQQARGFKLSTGSKEVDALLGGGIREGIVSQFFGKSGAGKTQLCATLCCTAQLSRDEGGANGKVFYIDTENAFSADRVKQIADRFDLDGDAAVDNIMYMNCCTTDMLEKAPQMIAAVIAQEPVYKLVIVDSIIATFRREYGGRGELNERQIRLGQVLHSFQRLAQTHGLGVVMTNQVTADPGNMFNPNAEKPVGGNILMHSCQFVCKIVKKKDHGVVQLIQAPDIAPGEAQFVVSAGGIDSDSA